MHVSFLSNYLHQLYSASWWGCEMSWCLHDETMWGGWRRLGDVALGYHWPCDDHLRPPRPRLSRATETMECKTAGKEGDWLQAGVREVPPRKRDGGELWKMKTQWTQVTGWGGVVAVRRWWMVISRSLRFWHFVLSWEKEKNPICWLNQSAGGHPVA